MDDRFGDTVGSFTSEQVSGGGGTGGGGGGSSELKVSVAVRIRPRLEKPNHPERYDATCVYKNVSESDLHPTPPVSARNAKERASIGNGSFSGPGGKGPLGSAGGTTTPSDHQTPSTQSLPSPSHAGMSSIALGSPQQPSSITIVNPDTKDTHIFAYDVVFDPSDGQEVVFDQAIARPLSEALEEGTHFTVVTYGQTGSGKTFTLLGEPPVAIAKDGSAASRQSANATQELQLHPDSGVYLRLMHQILQFKQSLRNRAHVVVVLSVAEIYNDTIRDLLNQKSTVQFREIGEDLLLSKETRVEITSQSQVLDYFEIAYRNRAVSQHQLNDESSRSHALFFVDVFQQLKTSHNPDPPDVAALGEHHYQSLLAAHNYGKVPQPGLSERILAPSRKSDGPTTEKLRRTDSVAGRGSSQSGSTSAAAAAIAALKAPNPSNDFSVYPVTHSRVVLVDLAGSERIKRSGVTGTQLSETLYVNRSLSALGHVVNHLCQGSKHIPFRDSKMTRILRNSFVVRHSNILFITNISPAASSFNETLGSLRFAARLKDLKAPAQAAQQYVTSSLLEDQFLKRQRAFEEICAELRVAEASVGFKRILHFEAKPFRIPPPSPAYVPKAQGGSGPVPSTVAVRNSMLQYKMREEKKLVNEEMDKQQAFQQLVKDLMLLASEAGAAASTRRNDNLLRIAELRKALNIEQQSVNKLREEITKLQAQCDSAVAGTIGRSSEMEGQTQTLLEEKLRLLKRRRDSQTAIDDLRKEYRKTTQLLEDEMEALKREKRDLVLTEEKTDPLLSSWKKVHRWTTEWSKASTEAMVSIRERIALQKEHQSCLDFVAVLAAEGINLLDDTATGTQKEKAAVGGATSADAPGATLATTAAPISTQQIQQQHQQNIRRSCQCATDEKLEQSKKSRTISPLGVYFTPPEVGKLKPSVYRRWAASPPPTPTSDSEGVDQEPQRRSGSGDSKSIAATAGGTSTATEQQTLSKTPTNSATAAEKKPTDAKNDKGGATVVPTPTTSPSTSANNPLTEGRNSSPTQPNSLDSTLRDSSGNSSTTTQSPQDPQLRIFRKIKENLESLAVPGAELTQQHVITTLQLLNQVSVSYEAVELFYKECIKRGLKFVVLPQGVELLRSRIGVEAAEAATAALTRSGPTGKNDPIPTLVLVSLVERIMSESANPAAKDATPLSDEQVHAEIVRHSSLLRLLQAIALLQYANNISDNSGNGSGKGLGGHQDSDDGALPPYDIGVLCEWFVPCAVSATPSLLYPYVEIRLQAPEMEAVIDPTATSVFHFLDAFITAVGL